MKIVVVHNYLIWYRLPLFRKLSDFYHRNISFIFTKETIRGYEVATSNNLNYRLLRSFRLPLYPDRICPSVIPEVIKRNYDIVIWGDNFLIESWIILLILKIFFRKRKFIIWTDEWGFPKSLLRRLLSPLFNFFFRLTDSYVVHGSKHKKFFVSIGIPEDKIFVSGSVSLMDYPKCSDVNLLRQGLGLEKKKVVLYVGRLIERKGVQYLIKAFAKLRKERNDVCLLTVGSGRHEKELRKLVRDLSINDVYFLGWVENKKLAPYYALCDIFVLPSRDEPWGLVLNESMSLGKPVIGTDECGASYDLIENGINGFIVKAGDVQMLYYAMREALEDPELNRRMGLESKRVIESRFTYEHMSEGFKEAIKYVSRRDKDKVSEL